MPSTWLLPFPLRHHKCLPVSGSSQRSLTCQDLRLASASPVVQRYRICLHYKRFRFQPLGQEDPLEKETANHSSFLPENPRDRGAWQATVRGITESWTRLSTHSMLACVWRPDAVMNDFHPPVPRAPWILPMKWFNYQTQKKHLSWEEWIVGAFFF